MSTATNGATPVAGHHGLEQPSTSPDDYQALVQWLREGSDSAVAPRNVGITSCSPRAGVSTVAKQLAIAAAAASERPVLLLDLSGVESSEPPRSPGDSVGKRLDRIALARATETPNLFLVQAADVPSDDRHSAEFNAFELLSGALEEGYGYVVVDLPTTESNLCCQAAGLLDGILLVIEAERTCIDAATRAKNRLLRAHANLPGVLLNNYSQQLPKWFKSRSK